MARPGLSRIKELFSAAMDLPGPQRESFLCAQCANEPAILRKVVRMIEAGEKRSGFLEDAASVRAVTASSDIDVPGVIGNYRVVQQIGEGGMGIVYLAEQSHPIRRRVALKLIKLGMDTRAVVARFEAERQALAMLNHPNIAHVFDAGATEKGRPYFVMEYVSGEPITRFCDAHNLTVNERLELFVQVCHAIQHAHQKGIIHRDIKPSNVLVTRENGDAIPKIIDFGVAKATEHRLTERTLFTEHGVMIGTPAYMSPEQAELSAIGVDARTDVYSLGVLLYELVVGVQPFESETLGRAGFAELQRIIREVEPSKPSTRFRSLGRASSQICEQRRVDPLTMRRLLSGDLDWITMKAIDKNPVRRYPSASELAADIQRHLADEPVSARMPTLRYRMLKFARRHRALVASAVTVFVVMAGALLLSWVQNIRTERARARSEKTSSILKKMLGGVAPVVARGKDTALLEELLVNANELIRQELADDPEAAAALHHTLGTTYEQMAKYKQAEQHLREAVRLGRISPGPTAPATLHSVNYLGIVLQDTSRYDEAMSLYREAYEGFLRTLGPASEDTLGTMNQIANICRFKGDLDEAERLLREALRIGEPALGDQHRYVHNFIGSLGQVLFARKQYDAAEPYYRRSVDLCRKYQGDDSPTTLSARNNLAVLCKTMGRLQEAEIIYRDVLARRERLLGPDHNDSLGSALNLAILLQKTSRLEEAEPLMRRVVQRREAQLGTDDLQTANAWYALADLLVASGRPAEAAPLYRSALRTRTLRLGSDHPTTVLTRSALADVQRGLDHVPNEKPAP